MNIASTQKSIPLNQRNLKPASKKAADSSPEPNFGADIPGYTGPADGYSQQKFTSIIGAINKAMIAGCYRMEVENPEKFKHDGAQVYCPTHPSMFDPPLIASLTKRDLRYPANIYVFNGIRGKVINWGGAFPLHRDKPKARTMRHMVDVIKQGKGFVIFPEGGIAAEQEKGQVGPLKKGAARLALMGGAEAITPIAIEYRPDTKERPGEALAGAAVATAVTVGGVMSAFGGPVTRAVAGAVTGAITGAYVGGKVNRNITSNPQWFDAFPKYFATVNGGLLGGTIGAIAGGLATSLMPQGSSQVVQTALGLGAGASTYKIAEGIRTRDIAHVRIGDPIPVAPYKEKYQNNRKAGDALTIDLHKALSKELKAVNGVEQLEPAFRGKVEETCKNAPPPPASGPNKLKATIKYGAAPVMQGAIGSAVGAGLSAVFGVSPSIGSAAGLALGVTTGALTSIGRAVAASGLAPELRV